jgi:glycosyltransferase involved in cell wall biosynthesis
MPRVSVLVPAFNSAEWVGDAIDSVIAQTFADWEVVAVDDGSSDATGEVIASIARRDGRVRFHRNAQNLGMTANWNHALSLASGDLVIKLDSDDVLKRDALQMLVSCFDDRGVNAAGVRTLLTDENLVPIDGLPADDAMTRFGIDPYAYAVREAREWYRVAAHGHQLWGSSAFMVRRGLLQRIGGFDVRFGCASDTELMLRILEQPGSVAHLGRVGAFYRIHGGSVSDMYRSSNWLTWEGVAAILLSLSRYRRNHALPRSLRMHYVRLWRRWKCEKRALPAQIETKLRDVMASVEPPPRLDVLMTLARDRVSAR